MFVGIDIGSLATKCVIFNDGSIASYSIIDSRSDPEKSARRAIEEAVEKAGTRYEEISYVVGTGYGRVAFKDVNEKVTELTAHARGTHFLCPSVRTVIDIGGQDSKVIRANEKGEMVDFVMNDKCAAGTGRFLEVISKTLEIPLERMGEVSLGSSNPLRLSSTCTVFAETEVVSLLAARQKKEDIAAGLHFAIARRVGNMVKSFGVKPDIAFVGGVAKNEGVRRALEEFLNLKFIPIAQDPQIIGALGAALIAKDSHERR